MDATLALKFVFEQSVDHSVSGGLGSGCEGGGCYVDAGEEVVRFGKV